MLTKKIEQALNQQIALEGYASFLYLAMASWCENEALTGCAAFMHRQSEEEKVHMMKLFHYINDQDGHAIVPAIAQPPRRFESIQVMFKTVYQHELKVTKSINDLVALSYEEKDHATFNFLQWYVAEQQEEEALMRAILDRIKLIGGGPQSLYYIDKEVSNMNAQQAAAGEAA